MKLTRRSMLAASATLAATTPVAACIVDVPELPNHPQVKSVAEQLRAIDTAVRDLRALLPEIPEIVGGKYSRDSYAAWTARELVRLSAELASKAEALRENLARIQV